MSGVDAERHTRVLCVDHVITDGHSAIVLLDAVWDRYRELVDGTAVRRTTLTELPGRVSELLPAADAD